MRRDRERKCAQNLIGSVATVLIGLAGLHPAWAEGAGRVVGKVVLDHGAGVSGVVVGLRDSTITTGPTGEFYFENVPHGEYEMSFRFGDNYETQNVVVDAPSVAIERVTSWRPSIAESLTVFSASRRVERIVDSPAAVVALSRREIDQLAPTGQLPKLFESAPGVEVTQSGLYDFQLNVRGMNRTVNRRLATLIDGRDPSFPFQGSQEWAAISFPLDDLSEAELIRGPSSALYGANAFNGVLNLITKNPSESLGGRVSLKGGDLDTRRLDFRHAQELGEKWYVKVLGGYGESDDFSRSRNEDVEYSEPCTLLEASNCLPLEAVPLADNGVEIGFFGARLDHEIDDSRNLSLEVGSADVEGYVLSTPVGRFQVTEVSRPWARANLNGLDWNLLGYYSGREANEVTTLSSGSAAFLDSFRAGLELQKTWILGGGKGRIVGGASMIREETDTANPSGAQTLLSEAQTADRRGVFGQLDLELSEDLALVVAARWDSSSIHESRLSPQASLVYAIDDNQTLRASYREGFQAPNYPELFLRVDVGTPIDLSGFESICSVVGVSCGFAQPIPLLAVGNEDLEVEKIRNVEVGYSAVLGKGLFLTVDYYRADVRDFVQVSVPQVGTTIGRTNPRFPAFSAPSELPMGLAEILVGGLEQGLGGLYPFLSNTPSGSPAFVFTSNANFGEIKSQGLELAFNYSIDNKWFLDFNYSWSEFEVRDELPEAPLEANGPENKANLRIGYAGGRIAGSLHYRWFDSFLWSEGFFFGTVPSYGVVNLEGSFEVSDQWRVGVSVSNLLDNEHYEFFSGDLVGRHALAYGTFSW